MNKRMAFQAGRDAGWSIASWIDMPAIGSALPKEIDWIGIGSVDSVSEQIEAFEMLAGHAEENSRQYAEFAMLAADINNAARDPAALWEEFDRGVSAGISANRRKRFPISQLKRDAKESSLT